MTTNATTTTKGNNKKTKKKKKMSKIIETKTNENDEKKGKKSDDAIEEEEEEEEENDDFNNTNSNNEKAFYDDSRAHQNFGVEPKGESRAFTHRQHLQPKDLFVKKSTLQTFFADFQLLRNVRELYLNENNIERVVNLDRLSKSLKLLHIEGNKLNSFGGASATYRDTLQTLSTRNNSIRDFSEVARKDGRKWDLEYLDVRENEFGNFADLRLVEEFVHLRELRLRSEENDKSEKNDKKSNKNNPVCKLPSYRMAVHAFIPWLEMLDDIGFTASSALVIEEEKSNF